MLLTCLSKLMASVEEICLARELKFIIDVIRMLCALESVVWFRPRRQISRRHSFMFVNVEPCLTSASMLMEVPKCLRNSLSSGGLLGFMVRRSYGCSISVQFD